MQSVGSSSTGTGGPKLSNDYVGGIFDGGLEACKTVTEEEYRALFASGLIAFDANALLNLYRYQAHTRHVLLDILTRLKYRLCIPNQAMFEFFQNRLSVIASRSEEAEQAIEDLQTKRITLEEVVRRWANRAGLPRENTGRLLSAIQISVDGVAEQIRSHSSDDSLDHADDTAKDPVIASLNSILERSVGNPLPNRELASAKKEARQRITDQRPPGWRDAKKRENPEGDYLIWYETLREARRRGTDVLFVTGDVKDDWWWRQKGEAKGPLPELAQEMLAVAGARLFMLRPESFLVHASKILDVSVGNETVEDVQRVTTEPLRGHTYIEESTGRSYRRTDLTGPGLRSTLSYEWHGVRPPQGRHWIYTEEKMDRMYAEGQIEFTNGARPVRKRYFDEHSEPDGIADTEA